MLTDMTSGLQKKPPSPALNAEAGGPTVDGPVASIELPATDKDVPVDRLAIFVENGDRRVEITDLPLGSNRFTSSHVQGDTSLLNMKAGGVAGPIVSGGTWDVGERVEIGLNEAALTTGEDTEISVVYRAADEQTPSTYLARLDVDTRALLSASGGTTTTTTASTTTTTTASTTTTTTASTTTTTTASTTTVATTTTTTAATTTTTTSTPTTTTTTVSTTTTTTTPPPIVFDRDTWGITSTKSVAVWETYGDHTGGIKLGFPADGQYWHEEPLAFYPLDGDRSSTVPDASPNDNDGTVLGDPTGEVAGLTSTTAYRFDGDDAIVFDDSVTDQATSEFTWAAFVATDATDQTLFQLEADDGTEKITLALDGGQLTLTDDDRATPATTTNAITSSGGTEWKRVMVELDDGRLKAYVNSAGTETVGFESDVALQPSDTMIVGGESGPSGVADGFDGRIDEVRLYDVALSEVPNQKLQAMETWNDGYVKGSYHEASRMIDLDDIHIDSIDATVPSDVEADDPILVHVYALNPHGAGEAHATVTVDGSGGPYELDFSRASFSEAEQFKINVDFASATKEHAATIKRIALDDDANTNLGDS